MPSRTYQAIGICSVEAQVECFRIKEFLPTPLDPNSLDFFLLYVSVPPVVELRRRCGGVTSNVLHRFQFSSILKLRRDSRSTKGMAVHLVWIEPGVFRAALHNFL